MPRTRLFVTTEVAPTPAVNSLVPTNTTDVPVVSYKYAWWWCLRGKFLGNKKFESYWIWIWIFCTREYIRDFESCHSPNSIFYKLLFQHPVWNGIRRDCTMSPEESQKPLGRVHSHHSIIRYPIPNWLPRLMFPLADSRRNLFSGNHYEKSVILFSIKTDIYHLFNHK